MTLCFMSMYAQLCNYLAELVLVSRPLNILMTVVLLADGSKDDPGQADSDF